MRQDLIEALESGWLKLPFAVMRDVGPAVQTLGGLLKITNQETFTSATAIAESARLPLATARKHLATLDKRGWIKNDGRHKSRRTCTIAIAKHTAASIEPYGVLPWWGHNAPWGARAVLSVVMAQLKKLVAAARVQHGTGDDWADLNALCGGELRLRFSYSLSDIERLTGLSRPSIVFGKSELKRIGFDVGWQRDRPDLADYIAPCESFRIAPDSEHAQSTLRAR